MKEASLPVNFAPLPVIRRLPLIVASPSTNINIPLHLRVGLSTTLREMNNELKFLITGGPSCVLAKDLLTKVLTLVMEPVKLRGPSLLSPK